LVGVYKFSATFFKAARTGGVFYFSIRLNASKAREMRANFLEVELIMFSRIYLLVFVLLISGFISSARAATFTVTLGGDAVNDVCDQFCSLREAINAANANGSGADTINFNLAANAVLIQPLSALPVIKTSLTIDGTTQSGYFGAPIIVLDGNGAGNANGFYIQSPPPLIGGVIVPAISVTIRGLAINRFSGNGIRSNCTGKCDLTVEGNRIGTNSSGLIDMGNAFHGIFIGATDNSIYNIGGTGTFEGNVISGNGSNGIYLSGAADAQLNIYGNYIGVNAGGSASLPNDENGVAIGNLDEPDEITVNIGGTNPAARNIISGNGENGILLSGQTTLIYGNYIGTDSTGASDLGNGDNGIAVGGNAKTTIGGTINGQNGGNLISGNGIYGIQISSTDLPAPILIKRNRIGTNLAGTAAVPNAIGGIVVGGEPFIAVKHIIGSFTNGADGNLISGNGGDGIEITSSISQIEMYANLIGTNVTATAKLPNQGNGIILAGAFNQVGLSDVDAAANVVSGNTLNGIQIQNTSAVGNTVVNNFIGTNAAGDNLGNGQNGVQIGLLSSPTQKPAGSYIGEPVSGSDNTIAFNGGDGVNILFGTGNRVQRNSIYSNGGLGIDLETNGVTPNDATDSDTGANNQQNYPILMNASPAQLAGTLVSAPNTPFTLDFYRVDSCDASGNGEGKYLIASKSLNVPNSGSGYFNYLDVPLTVGQIIVVTATDAGGNTSEFSPCYTVNPPPGVLSFSAATYTANEATGTRTIVVNRTNGNFGTIQVNYHTSDETAIAGQDYTETSGTLIFNNGETVKSFDVPIKEDALDEAAETLKLTLSFPTNGSYLVNPNTAILTIQDNDSPPAFSIDDVSQKEGNSGTTQFVFHVTLSAPSGLPTAVDYVTVNQTATASSDYTATSGHLDFAPGETAKTVIVTVNGDLTPELDETFFVNFTGIANADFGKSQGLGTILDDDSPGKFSFGSASYSGTEGQQVVVTVLRTNGTTGTVTVDYETLGEAATPGDDFTPVSGTLIFGDGETQKTFSVFLADDANPEPTENINLVLSNPLGGATIIMSTSVLRILDNDSAPISINGTIRYGITPVNQSQKTVSGVLVSASGASIASDTTDSSGAYSLGNLQSGGQYTVTLSKTGNVNGISPFDATLILRHVAANGQGPNALNANQQKAADANGSGSISPFDATQILRFVAANGKTPNTGAVGNWEFLPSARNYDAVNNSLTEQNYEAVLIGDVNGNWTPPVGSLTEAETPAVEETETQNQPDTVSELESTDSITNSKIDDSSDSDSMIIDAEISLAANSKVSEDGTILIPVRLTNYTGKNVSAYNFEAQFDSDVLEPDAAHPIEQNETLSKGFAIVHNIDKRGRIGIAASRGASRNQAGITGILLYLRFKIKEAESYPIGKAIRLTFTKKPVFEDENGSDIF
jgi:CSLREA domain-containing protein